MNHFQTCIHCGGGYWNKHVEQRFCTISCGNRKRAGESSLKAHKRRVEAKLASEPSRHGEIYPMKMGCNQCVFISKTLKELAAHKRGHNLNQLPDEQVSLLPSCMGNLI